MKLKVLVCSFTVSVLLAQLNLGFATEPDPATITNEKSSDQKDAVLKPHHKDCESEWDCHLFEPGKHKKKWKNFFNTGIEGGFFMGAQSFSAGNASSIINSLGFDALKPNNYFSGGMGSFITKEGWHVGGQGSFSGYKGSQGTYLAHFLTGNGGFYLGHSISRDFWVDIVPGITVGGGSNELMILTQGIGSMTEESFFSVEPSLRIDFEVFSFLRMGTRAAYLLPVFTHRTVKGMDIGARNMVTPRWNLSVEFVFGFFNRFNSAEE